MTTSDISTLVGNLGFPIFVSVYMLYQNSKLTDTIAELKNAITELSTLIRKEDE